MSRPVLTLKKGKTTDRVRMVGKPVGKPAVPVKAAPKPDTNQVDPEALAKARAWVRQTVPDYPFVIGIREQLIERKPDELPAEAVRISIWEIVRSEKYLSAFELATHRHSLDGETDLIAEKDRQFSAGRLYERKKKC